MSGCRGDRGPDQPSGSAAEDAGEPAADRIDVGNAPVDAAKLQAVDASGRAETGGAGSDAPGARADAGPPGAVPPPADCGSLHYCETFESYAVGSTPGNPWRLVLRGGAKLVVDGTKPFGGARSMHITAPAGNGAAALINQRAPALPVPGNNLFGRAMVFFNGAPPRNTHFPLFEVQGVSAVAGNVLLRWGGNGVSAPSGPPFHFNYKWTQPTSAESGATSRMRVPGGKWLCVQWQFDGSAAGGARKNEARIWINGAPINEMTVLASKGWNFGTPWSFMQLGFQYFQPTVDATELWIDDFALDGAMIPCPATP